jgi:hypothetical protein
MHIVFGSVSALLTLACLWFYWQSSQESGRWVGGGSPAGLVCGIAAGLVIVFEMLLWPRKLLRRLRLIPAKYWLAAHIWLGLASLPLAIAHSGFHWGGYLPMSFMILFVLTILSGIYGVIIQNILPRWMLRNLPTETIYNQIDFVSEQAVEDARQMLASACGRPLTSEQALKIEPELQTTAPATIVVGAVRQAGRTRGRTLETRTVAQASEDRDTLWKAFEEMKPFLLAGRASQSALADRQKADQWFSKLRSACGPESDSLVDILESMCEQRRQFDVQQTVHRWLHAWLPVHIGLSLAVTVLLAAHVWTALKYW